MLWVPIFVLISKSHCHTSAKPVSNRSQDQHHHTCPIPFFLHLFARTPTFCIKTFDTLQINLLKIVATSYKQTRVKGSNNWNEKYAKLCWYYSYLRIRIRICLFSYTQKKIQYEKYKLKCYIMKKESLSIIVSYINVVVNQTDAYKI